MTTLGNMSRIDETATFIASELKRLLDRRDDDSHMSRRIEEDCPAYENGLTNAESLLATLRALSMVQLEISADLAALTYGEGDAVVADACMMAVEIPGMTSPVERRYVRRFARRAR